MRIFHKSSIQTGEKFSFVQSHERNSRETHTLNTLCYKLVTGELQMCEQHNLQDNMKTNLSSTNHSLLHSQGCVFT